MKIHHFNLVRDAWSRHQATSLSATALGAITLAICLIPSSAGPLAIVNGDFETGNDQDSSLSPIAGWNDAGASAGFWLQVDNSDGSAQDPAAAQSGSLYLSANRLASGTADPQPASSTLTQTIAMDGTNLSLIQAGDAIVQLDFHFNDEDTNDTGEVTIVFLDSSDQEIGSITTGAMAATGANGAPFEGWALRELDGLVPTDTESMRIEITTNRIGGSATNVHFDNFSALVTPEDSDSDGLVDSYEKTIIDADPSDSITDLSHVAGPDDFPTITDFDNDGSSDSDEYDNFTDPLDPDSDDDGLLDGVETLTGVYSSPTDTGTDPLDIDFDFDGYPDGIEVIFASDPTVESSLPGVSVALTNPGFESPIVPIPSEGVPVSGGTVSGWEAVTNDMWVIDEVIADPINPAFSSEGFQYLTADRRAPAPDLAAGSFAGGNAATLTIRQSIDISGLASDIDLGARTLLINFDCFDADPSDRGNVSVRFLDAGGSDLGRKTSKITRDSDNGWQTITFPVHPPALTRTVQLSVSAENLDVNGNIGGGSVRNVHFDNFLTRLAHSDADDDDMADDWELANGLDPDLDDSAGLIDTDTLTNLEEFQAGTDPNLADTDGDTFDDDIELAEGSDPLDSSSFPITAEPVAESISFNLSGEVEILVSGLDPSRTYQLLRGSDLSSFSEVIETKVPAAESEIFTDTAPPTGNAFYIVEEVSSAP